MFIVVATHNQQWADKTILALYLETLEEARKICFEHAKSCLTMFDAAEPPPSPNELREHIEATYSIIETTPDASEFDILLCGYKKVLPDGWKVHPSWQN